MNRNKYYLSFLDGTVHHFASQTDTSTLYRINDDNTLEQVDATELIDVLQTQQISQLSSADEWFNPSNYLVSPFNSTDKFLNGGYFLTNQQEDLRATILKLVKNASTATFISLTGGAGTGKTLLAYDIAKSVREDRKKPLIIHCGQLNDGHATLKDAAWNIIPIKNFNTVAWKNYDLVVVDEAQRLNKNQVDGIKDAINENVLGCLFAYDTSQTLSSQEEKCNAGGQITKLCGENIHKLSEKIRTNKEIANFLKALLNRKRNFGYEKSDNIQIRYFNTAEDVKGFVSSLSVDEWEVLRFTPSQYDKEFHQEYSRTESKTSHEVIGQEFEGVAVVIDKHFTYNQNGKLIYRGSAYYLADKMLFQNITRARKRLLIVVQENEELLTRCTDILQSFDR